MAGVMGIYTYGCMNVCEKKINSLSLYLSLCLSLPLSLFMCIVNNEIIHAPKNVEYFTLY